MQPFPTPKHLPIQHGENLTKNISSPSRNRLRPVLFSRHVLAQTTASRNRQIDRESPLRSILPAFPMQTHQALDGILERLRSLRLDPPDCLPFNPSGERDRLRAAFNDVPRYLFRVFTPMSRGATDRI